MKKTWLLFTVLTLLLSCSRNTPDSSEYVKMNFNVEASGVTNLGNFRHERITRYSSCWGYTDASGREYALLGVQDGLSIVDITDAPDLKEISFIPGPSSRWREMKVHRNYAYVVNESGGGMQIIDLSDLPHKAELVQTYTGFQTGHTISVDDDKDILIVEGDSTHPVRVFSISDPLHPIQIASTGIAGTHDMMEFQDRLYTSEGKNGTFAIYDFSNPLAPDLIKRFRILGASFVHNAWPTEDGRYLFTTEETLGRTVKVWDMQDLNNIHQVGEYLGPNRYAHNIHIRGHYAYLSHYGSGLRILDIHDPARPREVAFMQKNITSSGAWGAYPYFSSGKVIISDIEEGLFVGDFDPAINSSSSSSSNL